MARHRTYHLVAFDPGERTGVCLARVDKTFTPETATPETFKIIDQSVLTVSDVFRDLKAWVKRADVVAYETWRLYESHALVMVGNDMQPSQVVGMIRYEAKQQKRKIVSNGAEVKKVAVARMPDWLKAHMALSSEQHDQDAIMHAWFAAMDRYYQEASK